MVSAPCASSSALASGDCKLATASRLIFATIAGGVFAGAKKPEPYARLDARIARFDDARYIGRRLEALAAQHRQRLDAAGLRLRADGRRGQERSLRFAADQRRQCKTRSFIRYVHEFRAGHLIEQFTG